MQTCSKKTYEENKTISPDAPEEISQDLIIQKKEINADSDSDSSSISSSNSEQIQIMQEKLHAEGISSLLSLEFKEL